MGGREVSVASKKLDESLSVQSLSDPLPKTTSRTQIQEVQCEECRSKIEQLQQFQQRIKDLNKNLEDR